MIKTVDPGMRRRRRCDKHNLDLTRDQPDLIPNSDTYPVTPITPPAAFLSLGYKRPSTKGKGEHFLGQHNNNGATDTYRKRNRCEIYVRNVTNGK